MYQTKHIPIRSCIGCGLKRPQKDFVKIVRTKHNSISIKLNNTSDKSEGRSIYMCRSFDCWTEAKKKREDRSKYKS